MSVQDAPKARDAESRELKVKVPAALHVRLHSVRILTGTSISAVVTDALARYFDGPGAEELSSMGSAPSRRRVTDDE